MYKRFSKKSIIMLISVSIDIARNVKNLILKFGESSNESRIFRFALILCKILKR